MGRIRTVKPSFFLDEDLADLPYSDRLLFIGLWLEADKSGRLEDRPKRLKGALFPYDDLNIEEGLGRLTNAGFLVRYEGDGKRLIAIPGFVEHQRPNHREPESILPDHPGTPVHAPVEGKGREGNKEGNSTSRGDGLRERFDSFWASYPRKEGKDAAWGVWERLKPANDLLDQMLAAIARQRQSPQWLKDGGQFIPQPRTYLNQGRWKDEPVKLPSQARTDAEAQTQLEAIKQQLAWRSMTPEQRARKLAEG